MCNHLEVVDTIELDDVTVNIYQDSTDESPREWDNLGTMACFHRRYTLGDKTDFTADELIEFLSDNLDKIIALPLYLYDHSGLSMSWSDRGYPFNDQWDAGQVGFIYVTYEKLQSEYHWKHITKARKAKIVQYLKNEVETYDQYLTGDVYGFEVVCNLCNDALDSCWGFYGHNWKDNGLLDYAKDNRCNCKERLEMALEV